MFTTTDKWTVQKSEHFFYVNAHEMICQIPRKGVNTNNHTSDEECEDNANAISAVPDMQAALEKSQYAFKALLEDVGLKGVKYSARSYSLMNSAYLNNAAALAKANPQTQVI